MQVRPGSKTIMTPPTGIAVHPNSTSPCQTNSKHKFHFNLSIYLFHFDLLNLKRIVKF